MDTTVFSEPVRVSHLDTPEARIDAALELLTLQQGDGTDDLAPALLAILGPLTDALGTDAMPVSPPPAVLQERIADQLASSWPRFGYADFSTELASDAMKVVAPVVDQLQRAARSWRRRAVAGVIERDQARDIAVALEQANAEAVRLLRSGQYEGAIAVLEGDCRAPEARAGLAAPTVEHEGARDDVHDSAHDRALDDAR
ncbi:hypothetical protein RCO28_36105 [Streptomyces sp. LHD-70]|uniref:hypothetical protein n=1 Tax=Streptomyces sp. LHD-70 TaxID=3072140 RepID=UPI00280E7EB7|nr:hypothetical protein [Streptomyces sp. LHD-70]MDQ8707854.1 hypothetical protein [Streptomyces sp. LHD-70]